MSITVRQAAAADIETLAPLFDAYRQFYEQNSDLDLARRFLSERFARAESVVFIAEDEAGAAVGFAQLYPSFTSTRAARIYVLNDLFVAPEARGRGAGGRLLATAADHGRAEGCAGLTLSTARTNLVAQALYEASGWKRDEVFLTYDLALD
ncbi:MAG TPA: GNAT family N-acetyltransferase [Caulobacteraceae bacterium]|nr:GNAT family N-acetyltransferase [Caulobacteraceae bacterium]